MKSSNAFFLHFLVACILFAPSLLEAKECVPKEYVPFNRTSAILSKHACVFCHNQDHITLDLRPGHAYENLVNQESFGGDNGTRLLVMPGNSDPYKSYLIAKLIPGSLGEKNAEGNDLRQGNRMPHNEGDKEGAAMGSISFLNEKEIKVVKDWIDNCAQPFNIFDSILDFFNFLKF